LLVAGGLLQFWIWKSSTTAQTVITGTSPDLTTIVTPAKAVPTEAIVTACLSAGAVLILAGAFFSRINKVVITGIGELDLDSQASLAAEAAKKTGGDANKTKSAYTKAAMKASGLSATAAGVAETAPKEITLSDRQVQDLIEEALAS
jgi:hypothetical protein